jgi:hypothetical protein
VQDTARPEAEKVRTKSFSTNIVPNLLHAHTYRGRGCAKYSPAFLQYTCHSSNARGRVYDMLSGLLHYSIAFLYCITLLAVYTQRLALVKRLEAYLKQLSVSSGRVRPHTLVA